MIQFKVLGKKRYPIILVLTVYHPRTLTSRNATWWLHVGSLLVLEFTYPRAQISTSVRSVSPSRAPEATCAHKSVLLHGVCRRLPEPHLSYTDAVTNVSFACSAVWNGTCRLKTSHAFVNCCPVWNRCINELLSEYTNRNPHNDGTLTRR
jgi:hypothetical protein